MNSAWRISSSGVGGAFFTAGGRHIFSEFEEGIERALAAGRS